VKIKYFVTLTIFITLLLTLCSCYSEPEEYSIGEMKFSISDNLTLEEDKDISKQNLIDDGHFTSTSHMDAWLSDVLYFYGSEHDLVITTSYVPFLDIKIDECIDEIYEHDDIITFSTDIDIDGAKGKIGHYSKGNSNTHFMYILKNGIFYEINLCLAENTEYPENYFENIAKTIYFDSELLDPQTISCGDLQFTLPATYQQLETDPEEDFHDEQYFGQYGEDYIEFSVAYLSGSDYNISDLKEIMPEMWSLEEYETSSQEDELGKYEFIYGYTADGESTITALLEYKENIYWFDLFYVDPADPQELYSIIGNAKDIDE
jgi:hypothetical protein